MADWPRATLTGWVTRYWNSAPRSSPTLAATVEDSSESIESISSLAS
jgi:hypothetical protein